LWDNITINHGKNAYWQWWRVCVICWRWGWLPLLLWAEGVGLVIVVIVVIIGQGWGRGLSLVIIIRRLGWQLSSSPWKLLGLGGSSSGKKLGLGGGCYCCQSLLDHIKEKESKIIIKSSLVSSGTLVSMCWGWG